MNPPLLSSLGASDLWFAVPLIVAVSLVYAATRHELVPDILRHAVRVGAWITGFMFVIFLVLMVIDWQTRG